MLVTDSLSRRLISEPARVCSAAVHLAPKTSVTFALFFYFSFFFPSQLVLLMSDTPETSDQAATERSPLLGSHPEQAERPRSKNHASSQDGLATDVEPNQQTEETEDPELVQRRKNVKSLLPVLGVGIFLAFLDQSIVAAINGEIGSDLHALRNVSWIATAYFLTMTASQPLYGKLSDIFGRKPCLLFAYTIFGLGSLGCGITSSMGGLIAGRVCQMAEINCDIGADTY